MDAARRLCVERDVGALTLADAAAAAGLSKAAVYGYFATKEELLLAVLARALQGFFDELAGAVRRQRPGDAAGVEAALLAALARRPELLRLLPRLAGELEHNLTPEPALAFKQATLRQLGEVGPALERALPWLGVGDGGRLLLRLSASVAGLWPMAHPVGVMRDVLARDELAPLRVDFLQELSVMVRALVAPPPSSPRRRPRSRP